MSHASERRNFQRVSVDCKIHFAVGPEEDVKKRYYNVSKVRDLSTEGVSFESPKRLEAGTFLHIKMEFSNGTSLKVRGEVQRCEAAGGSHCTVGVKFYGSAKSLSELFRPCV